MSYGCCGAYIGVIGAQCSLATDCSHVVNNSFCNTTSPACQCQYNYTSTTDGTSCVPRLIGHQCIASDQCLFGVSNSICKAGVCQCRSGYANSIKSTNATCVRRRINDTCVVSADCSDAVVNSACSMGGLCSCSIGFYSNVSVTQCIARVIGNQCSTNADCTAVIPLSVCTSGTCVCNVGYHVTMLSLSCMARVVGDPCSSNVDCSAVITPTAMCNSTEQNCRCIPGFYAAPGGASCQPLRIGYEVCVTDADCLTAVGLNTRCANATCRCSTGYEPNVDGSRCVNMVLGSSCTINLDCMTAVPGSECILSACRCPPLTTYASPDGSTCLLGDLTAT